MVHWIDTGRHWGRVRMGSKLRHLHVVYETPVSGLPESPDPKNVEGNGRERIEVWEVVVFVA